MASDADEREIFRSDYCVVRKHSDETVAVFVGNPPMDRKPDIVDARDLRDALSTHLHVDNRTLSDRIDEELVVDRAKALDELSRECSRLADFCYQDAPATSGFLGGVADDLREAQWMFADEIEEDRDDDC